MKKIFIAGQSGFLGESLVRRFKKKYEIIKPDKKLDLTSLSNAVKATRGADMIINSAGIVTSRVDQLKRPAEIFYTNSLIQFQLLEAAARNGIKNFISIASSTAYQENEKSPLKEEKLMMNAHPDIERGASYYGLSKWLVIPIAHAYADQYKINTCVVVFPNLYGPADKFHHETPPLIPNLVKRMHQAFIEDKKEFLAGGGPYKQIDLLFIEDAVDFLEKVVKKMPTEFLLINAGSSQSVTLQNICKLVKKNLSFRGTVTWKDSEKSDPRYLSNERASALYQWKPKTTIDNGIGQTVKWYLGYVKKSNKQ